MQQGPQEKRFITLEVSQIGWQIRGLGPGANSIVFHGQALLEYLQHLEEKMLAIQKELNSDWKTFNEEKRPDSAFLAKCLRIGQWAYALTLELNPLCTACVYGPTNPLRRMYIERLEEVYTKCFAAAYLYGDAEERIIGSCGLMTDFESNGGIDLQTGKPGGGIVVSMYAYHRAFFEPNERQAFVYGGFGELVRRIGSLIEDKYPACRKKFAHIVDHMLEGSAFNNQFKFTSSAKTAMIETLKDCVERFSSDATQPGQACATS